MIILNMKRALIVLFAFLLFPLGFVYAAEQDTSSVKKQLQEAADLYFSGNPKQALEHYLEISKNTQNKDAFLNAAFISLEQGNPKQAVDITSTAYLLYPQDPEVTEFTAEAYLADGQYMNAEKFFALLEDDPERAEFLFINLARTQLGIGESELAKRNLIRATAGKEHTPLSHYLLGQIYEQEKQWAEAAENFKQSIDYDHQFTEARVHYANALEKDKQYNDAYRQYRILHNTSPKNQIYIQALQRLKPKLTPTSKPAEPDTRQGHGHTFINPIIPVSSEMKPLRVALGTTAGGRPSPRNSVIFTPSHPFTITQKSNGNILFTGKAKETWRAELQEGKASLVSPDGKRHPFSGAVIVTPKTTDSQRGATILIQKVMSGAGMTWASVDDKEYRGQLEIEQDKKHNTLLPINIVNIEEYLMGVMSSEMPSAFPVNAQRAQAVLARTYALKHLGKHKAYGYDLCDTQNCQVYGGVTAETEKGNAAVESTVGEVLLYKNKPIESVFSANCGGVTQSSKDAGWTPTPYLNPVSDYKNFNFDALQPYQFKNLLQHAQQAYSRYDKYVSKAAFRWARVIDEADLRALIKRQKKDIGNITAIIPQKRGRSGYVTQVLVKGTKGSVTLSKENVIRNNLAPGMLRSSYFIVVPNYENRKLKNFVFYGGGWGHGVGFCQTGSAGRAEAGQDYTEILAHYFPGTELVNKEEKESNK